MRPRRTIHELLEEYRSHIDRVAPEDVEAIVDAGGVVVDTRDTADRTAEGVIPGSVHLPLSVLPWRADPDSEHRDPGVSDLDKPMIIVCNDGYSSSWAAATLVDMGFTQVGDLVGGHRGWVRSGRPVEHP